MVASKRQVSHPKPKIHNLVVIELEGEKCRVPDKPHLYVLRTQLSPDKVFESVKSGNGPKWISGMAKNLRADLIPNYRATTKHDVAEVRLERLKSELARKGFAINGDTKTWRVYVLNVDADVKSVSKNGGERKKVLYVGQTSATREKRLAQHQGKELSKSGKHIGSRKLKGRNLTPNKGLTPLKVLFTMEDAIAFETKTHKKLEALGYKVLGDVH